VEPINAQVAQRLRHLRQTRGLSLEDLASRSAVSRAMLSQIETQKTNPTIAVLWKIAAGLEVSFAELLALDDGPTVRLSKAREARFLHSEDGTFSSRPLLSNVPGHRVELYELRLAPEAEQRAEPHPVGSFEQLFCSRGRLQVDIEGELYELSAGDALFFPADRPHGYRTLGKQRFVGLSLILYGG
jgi:transcriptional regulator with XRE-family HTH domain